MKTTSIAVARNLEKNRPILWMLLAIFAVGAVLPNFPQVFPRAVLAVAQAVPAFLFALIHGARTYRLRGIVVFIIISLTVGYAAEALGVHTGFPFGDYHFTDGMGPKLFDVPVLMGPAYAGMGYVSWMVARVIAGQRSDVLGGLGGITLPLAASFVMVAWDIAIDPVLSTFAHYWTWKQGGAFFGVPMSNFLGWYATNYLIYQLFAFYARKRPETHGASPAGSDRLAVFFYAVCAAGIVLRSISSYTSGIVTDSAGVVWRVSDINAASALAAIFIMGAFVALALAQLSDRRQGFAETNCGFSTDVAKAEIAFSRQDEDEFEQAK